ncbi:MAG: hypothetical protein HC897_02930, partial [Thermoanaerobaculia bacterium]|nr:hypothetical protein [Thermoanaerobaculia bacterium]
SAIVRVSHRSGGPRNLRPELALDTTGQVLVAWENQRIDPELEEPLTSVHTRLFASDDRPRGWVDDMKPAIAAPEVCPNESCGPWSDLAGPAIAPMPDGDFLLVWRVPYSRHPNGGMHLLARRLRPSPKSWSEVWNLTDCWECFAPRASTRLVASGDGFWIAYQEDPGKFAVARLDATAGLATDLPGDGAELRLGLANDAPALVANGLWGRDRARKCRLRRRWRGHLCVAHRSRGELG